MNIKIVQINKNIVQMNIKIVQMTNKSSTFYITKLFGLNRFHAAEDFPPKFFYKGGWGVMANAIFGSRYQIEVCKFCLVLYFIR